MRFHNADDSDNMAGAGQRERVREGSKLSFPTDILGSVWYIYQSRAGPSRCTFTPCVTVSIHSPGVLAPNQSELTLSSYTT